MKNRLKKSLKLLEKFFQENTENYINKKISRIDNLNIDGEFFELYLSKLKYYYGLKITNSIIKENENLKDINFDSARDIFYLMKINQIQQALKEQKENVPKEDESISETLRKNKKKKIEVEKIQLSELEKEAPLFVTWLKTILPHGKHASHTDFLQDHVQVKMKGNDRYSVKFWTNEYEYWIVIRLPNGDGMDNGYCGAGYSSRKSWPGEDWTRGGDLADGSYIPSTFEEIEKDIIRNELVRKVY